MFDFRYASIKEIHTAFLNKQVTVRALVLSYLDRIAKIDHCPGALQPIIEINPEALFIADTLDRKLSNGENITPLFGIPVLLKDNINTADKLHTSAGAIALADNFAPYDAHFVKQLRNAGAIIIGKTNMTELANYMSYDNMPSGYSSRGGQVINAFNRSITPSGSSSGSAVAVAASFSPLSIGTETAGSIISPAGYSGVVGIKPTLGLVGRSGIIPISSTHDTAGPMARTVRDAAILLGVMAGIDPDDIATHFPHNQAPADYTQALDLNGLKNMRIGINRSQKAKASASLKEEKTAFDHLCNVVSDAGAILIDNTNIDSNLCSGKKSGEIMRHEFKACMNYYLSTLKGSTKMKTLGDIIVHNQINSRLALKFGQSILVDVENNTTGTMTEPAYIAAVLDREEAIRKLDNVFNNNQIDIMLCDAFTNIAPYTGFPSMTIPIGQKKNKIQISAYWISRRFDEKTLIKAAFAAEQLLGLSIKPELQDDGHQADCS